MADTLPPELTNLLEAADSATCEAAWTSFVERHSRLLLHTARSFGVDYDDGMDRYEFILSELRRDDFNRLRHYAVRGRSEFTTWLVVVGRRLCSDFFRRRYGRDRASRSGASSESGIMRRRLVDLVASEVDPTVLRDPGAESPEKQLRRVELSHILESTVGSLPARDRLLLKLRFEDDASVRKIAETMGFPSVFHVYRRLKTLLDTLREELTDRGVRGPRP